MLHVRYCKFVFLLTGRVNKMNKRRWWFLLRPYIILTSIYTFRAFIACDFIKFHIFFTRMPTCFPAISRFIRNQLSSPVLYNFHVCVYDIYFLALCNTPSCCHDVYGVSIFEVIFYFRQKMHNTPCVYSYVCYVTLLKLLWGINYFSNCLLNFRVLYVDIQTN